MTGCNRYATLSSQQLRHIHAACEHFERALGRGEAVTIEECLAKAPDDLQSALFRELLAIELERELPNENWPCVEDYVARFPDRRDDIDRVVAEVSMAWTEQGDMVTSQSAVCEENPRHSIGRYRLIGEIARGGMGVIHRGCDTELGRELAIKVLQDTHLHNPEVVQRFIEEAQIGGQLQHPGIAPVYELGAFEDKRPFFSMKLVEGETLAKLLAERKSPADERGRFLGIFLQICQTMAYAHSRMVIHRDLKPANIMVGQFGEVQVMDWGLAKVLKHSAQTRPWEGYQTREPSPRVRTRRSDASGLSPSTCHETGTPTQVGCVMGTPAYMPPEQALGEIDSLDERADVFGLGAVLCEILTGAPPYVAEDATSIFSMASQGKLGECWHRLDTSGADVDLIALTKGCLQQAPQQRPENARMLADRVADYIDSVENKLRQSEIERASQAARADAEEAQAVAERRRADAERHRLEQQQLAALKLKRMLACLTGVALLAVVSSLVAGIFWRESSMAKEFAEASETIARSETVRAIEQRRIAEQSLAKMERAERQAKQHAAEEVKAKQLAQQETLRATAATQHAEEQLKRFEWQLYVGRLTLAQADFESGRGGLAQNYLDECQPNLRGWEHRYLASRINSKQTLLGHTLGVACVAFSPDNQCIATGSYDGSARIWHAETSQPSTVLPGHAGLVTSLAFSPDGKRLLTGGEDQSARVWDVQTGRELLKLTDLMGLVKSVAFNPDGQRIAIGGGDPYQPTSVSLRDSTSGEEVLKLQGFEDQVTSLAFSPDGKRIVTACINQARVWDTETGQELAVLTNTGALSRIWCVAYSPDGARIATSAEDGSSKVWDAETGLQLGILKGHTNGVASLVFSPDGMRIATGSWDNTIKIWNSLNHEQVLSLKGHSNRVLGIAFSSDGSRIVSGSLDATAKVWDAIVGQQITSIKRANIGALTSMVFSPDSQRLATAGVNLDHAGGAYTLYVWDLARSVDLLALEGHTNCVRSLAYSPDGRCIASGGDDQTVRIWDASTGQLLRVFEGRTWPVAFSHDGSRLATGSQDNTLRILDAETGQETLILRGHTGRLTCVAFSPDGQRMLTSAADATARLWNAQTGQELHALEGIVDTQHSCHKVAFSPDGQLFAIACGDKLAKVWDAHSLQLRSELKGHSERVESVAFSPDGERIVTGSFDHSAKLWDVQRGLEVLSLNGHHDEVTCVAFSGDGQNIVTGTANPDNTVRIWNAASAPSNNTWPLPNAAQRQHFHAHQAERAERENQLFAAQFHLRRLMQDQPDQVELQARYDTVAFVIPFKLAFQQHKFATAARLWQAALAFDAQLGDDRKHQHTYNAACAAALAADGQGQPDEQADAASSTSLRALASVWLRSELHTWKKLLESEEPAMLAFIMTSLRHWQHDPDLTAIRDPDKLSKLPQPEQHELTALWAEVEQLLKKSDALANLQ